MTALSPEQLAAVGELQRLCASLRADVVIIGAMAYRTWIDDKYRHTRDVDTAIAIDLDDFARLAALLQERGWKQDLRREHRWYAPGDAWFDLIPAGPKLRAQQLLDWPKSGMKMSLVGFEHVFAKAQELHVSTGLRIKVIPLAVLTLLKIVAYLDHPYERQKDIEDLAATLLRYETPDALRFSDEALEANLSYETVAAYFAGKDLATLCSATERALVEKLFSELTDESTRTFGIFARSVTHVLDEENTAAHTLVAAFKLGFSAQRK
ncbi:MAG TPA: nucleotidyl transferase AbiEii/AbiGii toxin family protein [Bryobacteraceae bacterium]|nr:nucleotidyl transferase AbiEii/AbiGii toxin family protein [Bryobacteraceae bacterium]